MDNLTAIKAMHRGYRVTHKNFTGSEWMIYKEGYYIFEDGCRCPTYEFWSMRTGHSWLYGWKALPKTDGM